MIQWFNPTYRTYFKDGKKVIDWKRYGKRAIKCLVWFVCFGVADIFVRVLWRVMEW